MGDLQAKDKKRRASEMSGNQTPAVVIVAIVGALGGLLWWRRRKQAADKPADKSSSFKFPKPVAASSLPRCALLLTPSPPENGWFTQTPFMTPAGTKSLQEQGSKSHKQQEAAQR